jgi:apolipoprotein N-acyltransferase
MTRRRTPRPPTARVAEQPAASRQRIRAGRLLALLCGAALSLAFAPFGQWWLALAAPALLMALWARCDRPREGAWLGFSFGLGLYASGTWWLYISIRIFGEAPVLVALVVMLALVLIMAAYQALLGYIACRWLRPATPGGRLLWVPAAWVLVEWLRGWFLTGFPWLSLGYSQTDTWLAGLAPVGGVPLVSLALLTGAGALLVLAWERGALRAVALVALVLPWTTGLMLRAVEWTHPAGEARSVAIVQGAIPQDMKWQASNRQNILDTYARLHQEALGADLIVWPESSLPDVANRYSTYIANLWAAAANSGSGVLMGVMRVETGETAQDDRYFNSILGLGTADPVFYDKRQLVPFAEFFPVPSMVRSWLRLMGLPNSDFTEGAARQPLFDLAGMNLAASICYEDAYPGLLRRETRASAAMVTVTNDAWFGRSPARYQHLQITRMRALEARRYLVRAANDGVSAVVAPDGRVVARAREHEPVVLRGEFIPRSGATPYLATGNWPVLTLALLLVALPIGGGLRTRRRGSI